MLRNVFFAFFTASLFLPPLAAGGGFVQEITTIDVREGRRVVWTQNGFIGAGKFRIDASIPSENGRSVRDQLAQFQRGGVTRIYHEDKTFLREELSTGFLPPAVLFSGASVARGNTLAGREANLSLSARENTGPRTCDIYSVDMDFQFRAFRTGRETNGKITGKAWICPPVETGQYSELSKTMSRYKKAAGTALSPLDDAAFAVADVSGLWQINIADVKRIAGDIAGVLSALKGEVAATQFVWHLPAPPAQGLRSMSIASSRSGFGQGKTKTIGEEAPPPDEADSPIEAPRPSVEIQSKLRYLPAGVKIDEAVFRIPKGYRDRAEE